MISKSELENIIINTKIAFSEAEKIQLQQKINDTIQMVSIIQELDLTTVEPMFYPNEQVAEFRSEDLQLLSDPNILTNTKETEGAYFKFPAVLKEEQ